MTETKTSTVSINPDDPIFTIYKHNLDEEFIQFFYQLYDRLDPIDAKITKEFVKLSLKQPADIFEKLDIEDFISTLNKQIIQNEVFFENQSFATTKELLEKLKETIQSIKISSQEIYKQCANIQINDSVFENISPFRKSCLDNLLTF